jgi:adenosylhomocysteinase
MALSFANQMLSIVYLSKKMGSLETKVYDVPEHIDRRISEYALNSFGIGVDQSNGKSF